MYFEKSSAKCACQVVGYRENAGEYNGKEYHNYILYCLQPVKGEGACAGACGIEFSLPDSLGISPASVLNKKVVIEFNFYKDAKRQKITAIKVA